MLAIRNLNVHYGGIHALRGIDIDVPDGKIISLIGANGAGKSTTLKSVMGLVPKSDGHVYWDDTDITSLKTKDIVGETDTGAELDTGVGPFASVNVASAVINGKGRIVGHDIIVIERQIVHAKAIGQFELVIDVPFILGICTDLIETDPCRRILISVEAPVISH